MYIYVENESRKSNHVFCRFFYSIWDCHWLLHWPSLLRGGSLWTDQRFLYWRGRPLHRIRPSDHHGSSGRLWSCALSLKRVNTETIDISTGVFVYSKNCVLASTLLLIKKKLIRFCRYLFYTDTGDAPYIGRSSMDGTFKEAIVATKIRQVNGLAIDYTCKSEIQPN